MTSMRFITRIRMADASTLIHLQSEVKQTPMSHAERGRIGEEIINRIDQLDLAAGVRPSPAAAATKLNRRP